MIVDAHAHAFPYVASGGQYGSPEEHLLHWQQHMTTHRQGARRFRDNALVTEPTLWDGEVIGRAGLLEVGFRAGKFGRFEWEKDGERYYHQFFPPSLENMQASPERMLAQMQYVGVDRALIQYGKNYGVTNAYMADVVRRWPDRFRCCTAVDEDKADRAEVIEGLRRSVRELGLTALYYSNNGFADSDFRNHFDDPRYDPLWEEVAALGIPIAWDIRFALKRSHADYLGEVVRLTRVARRLPLTQHVLTHTLPTNAFTEHGEIPDELWTLLAEPNVYAELLFPILYGERWEYPYAEAQPIIRQLYERLGASKLIWGSDMPNIERNCTYRQSLDYLRKHCPFIPHAEMDLIVGGNADQIYFSIVPSTAVTA